MALGSPVWGQTPAPSGGASPPGCQEGELCIPQNPAATSGGGQVLVGHDPPAHFARSLVTMGCIALVLGAFLLMAVTGKRLPLHIVQRLPMQSCRPQSLTHLTPSEMSSWR